MTRLEAALEALSAAVGDDPAARRALAALLHRVAHDLNNPIGVLALEEFNLRGGIDDVAAAAAGRDGAGVEAAVAELGEVVDNVAEARRRLAAIVATLEAAAPPPPEA